jgi:hypothetical protein
MLSWFRNVEHTLILMYVCFIKSTVCVSVVSMSEVNIIKDK